MADNEQTAAETEPTADAIPAPLAAAVQEDDTVLQAHIIRQANHESDLAPTIAKRTRDDEEREARLKEQDEIDARWRKHVAEQQAEQKAREERETAAATAAALRAEAAELQASAKAKIAEATRLEKLVKG